MEGSQEHERIQREFKNEWREKWGREPEVITIPTHVWFPEVILISYKCLQCYIHDNGVLNKQTFVSRNASRAANSKQSITHSYATVYRVQLCEVHNTIETYIHERSQLLYVYICFGTELTICPMYP